MSPADPWTRVVFQRPSGAWSVSAHRSAPDAWELHPGRWPTWAEASEAAAGWDPGAAARKRPQPLAPGVVAAGQALLFGAA
jgi:hypothetical protein